MKISVVKECLLEELSELAKMNSFKIVKKDFSLISKKMNRELKLYFTYNSWGDEVHLFPMVSIDLLNIIEIAKKNDYILNKTAFMNLFVLKEYMNNRITEDTVWKMQLKKEDRICFTNLDELQNIGVLIEDIFLNYGIPYFEKYSNVDKIDEMYNKNPKDEYNPNCSGMNTHCIIGLISAKLSNNKNYDELSEIYSEIVLDRDFNLSDKQAFFRIKKYLKSDNV